MPVASSGRVDDDVLYVCEGVVTYSDRGSEGVGISEETKQLMIRAQSTAFGGRLSDGGRR